MKKLFNILGILAAIAAVVLAVLPLFKMAVIPIVIAFIFGILAFIQTRKDNSSKTVVQLIFVITILALALIVYKSVTVKSEVGDTKKLEQREKQSEEKALEELDDIEIIE